MGPWVAYFVEALGILSVLTVCGAIGFSVIRTLDLMRGEKELGRRLRSERLEHIHRLIHDLSQQDMPSEEAIRMLEKYLAHMPRGAAREELGNALRQPLARGRRAYAEKLLRAAGNEKTMASSGRG
jgi:hypothetical protein